MSNVTTSYPHCRKDKQLLDEMNETGLYGTENGCRKSQ